MRLTAQAARDLEPGGTLIDHEVKGLQLRARAQTKTWVFRYTAADGSRPRHKIGHFPTIPLENARKLAKEFAQRVARGENPHRDRVALREAPTVAELFDLFLKIKTPKKKPRSLEEDKRNWRLHCLPVLGAMKVQAVEIRDVRRCVERVPGKVAPNRVRSLLNTMFNIAESAEHGWRPKHTNPVEDIEPKPEMRRLRKMELHEFAAIARELNRLEELYPRQVAVLRVSVLAGTRITELASALHRHFKGDRIERDDHKGARSGEMRVIYLPSQAVDVIRKLPVDGSPYIFGRGLKRAGFPASPHLTRHNVFDVWQQARAAVPGAHDLRPQDLRRTFASVAGAKNVGLDMVGQLFGHQKPETTRGYQHVYDHAATANVQAVADEITKRLANDIGRDDVDAGNARGAAHHDQRRIVPGS